MTDVDQKMPLRVIDLHVAEFRELAQSGGEWEGRRRRRFLAKGAYLSALRDSMQVRLEVGWSMLQQTPDDLELSKFWFDLLRKYEDICDTLSQYAEPNMREEAASFIFGLERINDGEPT